MRLFICLLFLLPAAVVAQDHKELVQQEFVKYYNHIRNKEFNEATGYMNPAFFKLISREQLVQAMEKTFNDPSMEFKVGDVEMGEVGALSTIDGMRYCRLSYGSPLQMRFSGEDTKGVDTTTMKRMFESQFGQGNVKYDAATEFYTIQTRKRAIANSADGKKWTFVVVEEKQRKILETFIPKELLD